MNPTTVLLTVLVIIGLIQTILLIRISDHTVELTRERAKVAGG